MSRQTRLIIILAGMGFFGVVALSLIAERYSRVLSPPRGRPTQSAEQAAHAAQLRVDAFARVRSSLRERIDAGGFDGLDPGAETPEFDAARERACAEANLAAADYRELRGHYRRWKQDPAGSDEVWRRAFDARRAELAAADLGEFETLDR